MPFTELAFCTQIKMCMQCVKPCVQKYNLSYLYVTINYISYIFSGGHGGRVVTLSPPTSEAGVRSPSRPYVGKVVVACRWSAVYSTEP